MIRSDAFIPPAAVARHYDELDRFYREIWGEHVHHGLWITGDEPPEIATRQLVFRVAEHAVVKPGAEVCDVGSGYGATSRVLAREWGARVTAFTISQAQHAYASAQEPQTDNPTYLLRDWLENDLPSTSRDAILAIESTEHMEAKDRFFAEAFRVLRPGGRLVVCAWLAAPHPSAWQRKQLLVPICREGRLPGMGTEREYRDFLTIAGFRINEIDDLSRQVWRTWPICLRRIGAALVRDARYRRFLLDHRATDRIFLLTVARIWVAYRTGAMQYKLFTAVKP